MFEKFASKYGGTVLVLTWCEMDSLTEGRVRRPSCDGHATIAVPAERLAEAQAEADEINDAWRGWGSIEVVEL